MYRTYPWASSYLQDSSQRTPSSFTPITVFALIGLILLPLAVAAHAPVSPTDSVHFYAPFDYEKWRRDHPRPAGKRLAALDIGEPRTVRMIYFLPNDRPYRQEVVDEMKVMMRRVQTFFTEQMQAHGYGNATFRFESDAQGAPLVHRVDGQHPESHYNDNDTKGEVLDEIYFGEGPLQFELTENDYLIVMDNSTGTINVEGYEAGGVNQDLGKQGGITLVPSDLSFSTIAHELGHTFGLWHDFRDDAYIMSYGGDNSDRLSACAAEFLSVHPYFNADISLGEKYDLYEGVVGTAVSSTPSTIQMISPSDYPAGSTSVSIRFKVSDADGLHQVLLLDTERESDTGAAGLTGLIACRGLNGEQDAVVEFEYDVSIPPFRWDPSDPEVHKLYVRVVDSDGEAMIEPWSFNIAEASSYHIATLQLDNPVSSLSFSPDGTLLATAEELSTAEGITSTVRLWDAASRQQVATLRQSESYVSPLSFSPDGTLLAIGTTGENAVSLWDAASRQQVATLRQSEGWVFSLSFSPDGTLLAIGTAGENAVSLWDVATRQQVATLQVGSREGYVSSLSFSPDGTLLAIGEEAENAAVSLWDVATRQQVATLQTSWVSSLSFSPDGTLLATGGLLNQLWDVATRQEITLDLGNFSNSLSFSLDGTLLAIGESGPVRLWNMASRQLVATFVHPGPASGMSFSPDGTLAVGGDDGTVSLWDTGEIGRATTDSDGEEDDDDRVASTLTRVSGDGQQGPASEPLANPFVVSVLDQNGSAFAGAVVTFSVTAGGGTLSATTAATDASGRARSTLTLGSELGTNTVAATVAGLGTVTFTATAVDQTPHSLTKVSGDGQQGPASTQLTAPLVVSVLDQDDSPLAGVDVTFSITAGGGMLSSTTAANSCTVGSSTSSTTATTDANGQAATRLTLGSEPGTNTVAATVEDLEPVTFTATAAEQAVPHRLTKVCGDDQEGTAGAPLTEPLVVSVSDEDGAAMAGVIVSFAVTAGGGTLSSATATTDANGRAATRLTLGSDLGTNTVEATVAGLESVTFTATGQEDPLLSLLDAFGSGKLVALPDRTQLLPNAPNPFNSQTVLSYFLLEPGLTRLEVFALTGQRVAILHQGSQQAGYHRLHWDGRDAAGRSVASGTYLYRLVTDEVVLTRKLVLLR